MKMSQYENLSTFDRIMRVLIGIGLCLTILIMPLQAAWIAALSIAALYPMLTSLTAVDPFFAIVEKIAFRQAFLKNKLTGSF